MRRAGWSFASLLALSTLQTVAAQSSHLSDLERAAPAATGDPVATGAAGGWSALWSVPAAAPTLRGVLVGLEQNEFGSVTTVVGAARLRLGLLWQMQFAQSHLGDVIDPELLALYPDLAALRVFARTIALDGLKTFGRATMAAGLRHETDELLGVRASGVTTRASALVRLGRGTAVAGLVDRAWSSSLGTPAGARAQLAVSQDAATKAGRLQFNAGARAGRLRDAEPSETAIALGATLTVHDLLSVNSSAGTSKFGDGPWTWTAAFRVSIELGTLGAHFRYSFRPEGRGALRAVAVTYTQRDSTIAH